MWQIGPYQVIEEIGRGGMGVVYRAIDPAIGRPVAVKTLIMEAAHTEEEKEFLRHRLIREAQSAGMLSHPNIVTIYQMGQHEGKVFIAMEFVTGRTLEALVNAGQLTIEVILSMVDQMASALDYAHRKGVVHRDIKPSNIMVDPECTVKITDFGLARVVESNSIHTKAGMVLGSAHYMSPEQIQGRLVDGRSDQYSLAVMAYRTLTGERPFAADQITALFYKILMEAPEPARNWNPTLTEAVDQVLNKALAKKAEDRYATCQEFANDLRRACQTPSGHFRVVETGISHSQPQGGGISGSASARSYQGEAPAAQPLRPSGGIAEQTPPTPTFIPANLIPQEAQPLSIPASRSYRSKAGWFVSLGASAAIIGAITLYLYFGHRGSSPTPTPLTISTSSLPIGESGTAYETSLQAVGGNQPYRWSGSSIPPGLRIEESGRLTGVPQRAGNFRSSIRVIDSQGVSASRSLNLTFSEPPRQIEVPKETDSASRKSDKGDVKKEVPPRKENPPPPVAPLFIHSVNPPPGTVGKQYQHTFEADGDSAPYRWSISKNRLPDGLRLDESGHVTGVPKQAGEFRIAVRVSDMRAHGVDREFVFTIRPGPTVRPALPADQYYGPTRGSIRWTGNLRPSGILTIEGGKSSEGSLNGDLPRIPVQISVSPREVEIVEAPSAANQWDRLVIRNNTPNPAANVTIQWNVNR